MEQAHYYEVDLSWDKDRIGSVTSPILDKKIEVATPPEFPKGIAGVWSPEHLFVAAINSCLMTTFLAIAENSNLEYKSFDSKAIGKLENIAGKFQISEVVLMPRLTIRDEQQKEKAEKVIQKAKNACLISNSVKTNITLDTLIIIDPSE